MRCHPSLQLYVLYPEESGRAWRIQAVPESAESFASRKAMPEPSVPPLPSPACLQRLYRRRPSTDLTPSPSLPPLLARRRSWRGVRDADLSGVTGIAGCVFCHAAGFIGVRPSSSSPLLPLLAPHPAPC